MSAGLHNLRAWPAGVDFYPYLADFNGLITDYSSVLYDFLALRSDGAILYTFDLEEYQRNDRQLLYPFEDNVAGLRCDTFDQLCSALRGGLAFDKSRLGPVDRIRQQFWGESHFPASPAIVAYVERLLREGDY